MGVPRSCMGGDFFAVKLASRGPPTRVTNHPSLLRGRIVQEACEVAPVLAPNSLALTDGIYMHRSVFSPFSNIYRLILGNNVGAGATLGQGGGV